MIGIYKITNNINNKSYIGQSTNIKRRFVEHKNINKESNKCLKYAYKKYGIQNFTFEILEQCGIVELNDREIYWIKILKPEYNLTSGGDGAPNHRLSEETKEKRKQTFKRLKENGFVRTNENHRKKVICIETGEIFNSLKEAETKYGLTTLCAHLKGKYETCKGKHYKYYQVNSSVTTNTDECKCVE